MKRSSKAIWHGPPKKGEGSISSESRVLDNARYTWDSRFGEAAHTSPEELIAAAHASCVSMKLGVLLDEAGYRPEAIETNSTVTMEDGKITDSRLEIKARVPGISSDRFKELAERAREESPVSRALDMNITLDANLD